MPRYFFHSQDGQVFHDDEGLELEDFDAAQAAALQMLAEAIRNTPKFWIMRSLMVTVTDEAGLVLLVLDLTGTISPAASNPQAAATLRREEPGRLPSNGRS